ncbi:MAG: hypothetical protein ACFB51_21260 [Anaerolineae bacterium]
MTKTMWKGVLFLAAALVAFGVSTMPAAAAELPVANQDIAPLVEDGCSDSLIDDLSGELYEEADGTISGVVVNNSQDCAHEAGLAVYEKFNEVIDFQRLYDAETKILEPGEIYEFTVELPECNAQVDLFRGELLESLDGQRYGERLIEARNLYPGSYCENPPEVECQIGDLSLFLSEGQGNTDPGAEIDNGADLGVLSGILNFSATSEGGEYGVSKIIFELSGAEAMAHTEHLAPYYFLGDTSGVPNGWNADEAAEGSYSMTVSSFWGSIPCDEVTVTFDLGEEPPAPICDNIYYTNHFKNDGISDLFLVELDEDGGAANLTHLLTTQYEHQHIATSNDGEKVWIIDEIGLNYGYYDVLTETYTEVGQLTADIEIGQVTQAAFDLEGTLWIGSKTTNRLFTVDLGTGVATNIGQVVNGETGGTIDIEGADIAFDAEGTFYLATSAYGGHLYTVDTSGLTPTATLVNDPGKLTGMAILDEGSGDILYSRTDDVIWRLDRSGNILAEYDMMLDGEAYESEWGDMSSGCLEEPVPPQPEVCYAQEVVLYEPGLTQSGNEVPEARQHSERSLGEPQRDDTMNFVSLGIGGTLILDMGGAIFDGDGADINVVETSWGDSGWDCDQYPEHVEIWAAQTLDGEWGYLGEICRDGSGDLADAQMSWARYVKLIDGTGDERYFGSDGYDVDGVTWCETEEEEEEPVEEADLSLEADMMDAETRILNIGDTAVFSFDITNTGNADATGITLNAQFSEAVGTPAFDGAACFMNAGIMTCDLGQLAAGETTAISLEVSALAPDTFVASAEVSMDADDPTADNNSVILGDVVIGQQLVANGDFNADLDNWTLRQGGENDGTMCTEDGCVLVLRGEGRRVVATQQVAGPGSAGDSFTLSGLIGAQNLSGKAGIGVYITYVDDTGAETTELITSDLIGGTTDGFLPVDMTIVAEADYTSILVVIGVQANGGVVAFDQVGLFQWPADYIFE